MSKISELSDGGVIQGGDTLIAVRSGGNVKVTYGGSTTANIDGGTIDGTTIGGTTPAAGNFTTGSFTGNVSFGDNDKAIFGAGSDLQIYHNGLNSIIDNTGTGSLIIQDTDGTGDILIRPKSGQTAIAAYNDNTVELGYAGNVKLATTSGGVSITGNLDADGAELSGNLTLNYSYPRIKLTDSDSNSDYSIINDNGEFGIYDDTNSAFRLKIDTSGNLDVGAVTADGLEVEAATPVLEIDSTTAANLATLQFTTAGTVDSKITHQASTGTMTIDSGRNATWGGEIDFVTDTDTRMQIASNGDISFYEDTGTTAKLFWDASAESLGIGTSSIDGTLHLDAGTSSDIIIEKDNAGYATLRFHNDGSQVSYIQLDASEDMVHFGGSGVNQIFYASNAERMRVNSTGIDVTGTATADALTVSNSSGATLNINTAGGATDAKILLHETATATSEYGASLKYSGAFNRFEIGAGQDPETKRLSIDRDTGDISFYEDTGTTAKFFWDASAERLGLGTSDPATRLHLSGGDPSIRLTPSGTNDARIDFTNNAGTAQYYTGFDESSGHYIIADENGFAGSNVFTFTSAGNVGIGTSNPSNKLDIKGTVGFEATNSTNKWLAYTYTDNSLRLNYNGAGADEVIIDSGGNLLVGTTTASIASTNNTGAVIVANGASQFSRDGGHTLDINRVQDGEIVRFRSAGNAEGSISISGSTTSYNTSSDQRLKDNIVDAPSASDDIDAIQVRSFDWKADGLHQKYGMVAQELQGVAPEAVTGDADSDDMMGVDYSKLVPMMMKEIQSLRARVAQLEGVN